MSLRAQCPQCRRPLSWRRRLLTLGCWWPQWRCDGCGAWIEMRFSSQMLVLYGLIPGAVVLFLLRRWPRVHAPWAGLALAGMWVWMTSRLAVAHWSSTHCPECGYPLPPLKDLPAQTARVCPECGGKS